MSIARSARLLVVAALLLIAGSGSAEADKKQKKRKPAKGANINLAEARFSIGDFSDADGLAAAVLEAEPENFRGVHLRGRVALLSNRLEEAETWLLRAVELRPTHREAREHLARVYYRQDRFEETATLLAALGEKGKAAKLGTFAGVPAYDAEGTEAVLPFIQTDPLPVVRLSVNGSDPAAFIIDTGASEVYLDTEWAAEIGIETLGVTRGTFGGGRQADVGHGRAESLRLGELVLRNVPVQLLDTTPFSAVAPGEDIRGVLGTVLFYHFLATLDYPAGELRLEPRRADEGDDGIRIPFWLGGDHYIVAEGRANVSDPLLFLVDTGLAGLAFTCPRSTVDEAEIELIEEAAGTGVGGGGPVQIVPFMLETLSLGEAERQNLPGVFGPFPEALEHSAGFRIGGLISHGFLRPWAVTFDFDSMQIILRQAGDQ